MAQPFALRVNRKQLEAVFGSDREAIRQFELLFRTVDNSESVLQPDIEVQAQTGIAQASTARSIANNARHTAKSAQVLLWLSM
jgi:hypothetical protein